MRFEDVELGDELPDTVVDVSMAKIKKFTGATKMNFPRFTDHEFARSEGFKGALVPGIMNQAMLASMIHAWAPGCQITKIDTVFRSPVLVDTAPVAKGAVTDTDEDARQIEIDVTLVNEDGSTGVLGTAFVTFPE